PTHVTADVVNAFSSTGFKANEWSLGSRLATINLAQSASGDNATFTATLQPAALDGSTGNLLGQGPSDVTLTWPPVPADGLTRANQDQKPDALAAGQGPFFGLSPSATQPSFQIQLAGSGTDVIANANVASITKVAPRDPALSDFNEFSVTLQTTGLLTGVATNDVVEYLDTGGQQHKGIIDTVADPQFTMRSSPDDTPVLRFLNVNASQITSGVSELGSALRKLGQQASDVAIHDSDISQISAVTVNQQGGFKEFTVTLTSADPLQGISPGDAVKYTDTSKNRVSG